MGAGFVLTYGTNYAVVNGQLVIDGGGTWANQYCFLNSNACIVSSDAGIVVYFDAGSTTSGGASGSSGTTIILGSNLPPPDYGASSFLYVSTTGSDTNACTSAGTAACRTIEGARRKIPKLLQHHYTIQVGAGTFAAGAYLDGFTCDVGIYTPSATMGPGLSVQGTLAAASLGGLMSGSVTSATLGNPVGYNFTAPGPANWGTMSVSGAGWTTNALAGYAVCITSGTGAGSLPCPMIRSNTATVATLVGSWPSYSPNSTSHFQIEAPSTIITGALLSRPPGTIGGVAYSSSNTSAFFVSGNGCPGYRSGDSTGLGTSYVRGDGGTFTDESFTEPQISISNFSFQLNDYQDAVGLSGGNQSVAFFDNWVRDGQAVDSVNGATLWALANDLSNDTFGNFGFRSSNTVVGNGPVGSATLLAFGNYITFPNSGGFSAGFAVFGPAIVAQNYVAQTDDGGTEFGILYGNGASIWSAGNQFWWLGDGIADLHAAFNVRLTEDNDDFETCGQALYLRDFSQVVMINDPITGTGNTEGIDMRSGTQVHLNGTTPSLSAASDIVFEDPTGNGVFPWSAVAGTNLPLYDANTESSVVP